MNADALTVIGVDGSSGRYLVPELSPAELADAIVELPDDETQLTQLRLRDQAAEASFGLVYGSKPEDLAEAGWGIVASVGVPAGVLTALKPLCDHRQQEAGDRFRAFTGDDGYRRGETKTQFLARHGMGTGQANPELVPYYLLLVGGPDSIPFPFQHELDVQYAVGRIAFDTVEDYARYAAAVVTAERVPRLPSGKLRLFGPRNPDDDATRVTSTKLVQPLAKELAATTPSWDVDLVVGHGATKTCLADLLWGEAAPDVLFAATHGIGLPHGHPLHREEQGALVCQDWPGPRRSEGRFDESFYLAAADLPEAAQIKPRVIFSFACFGAGTPDTDEYVHVPGPKTDAIGTQPFVARLPQRLLAHPSGGVLAFVGHIERAWTYSFMSPGAGAQLDVFKSALRSVVDGVRVGHAMEFFGSRYAELSTALTTELYKKANYGVGIADPVAFAQMWTANNDARGYVVMGDPAVRVAAAAQAKDAD